jgi:hypothetical protein
MTGAESDSSSESPPLAGPSGNVRLPSERVLGPLARTLSQIAQNIPPHQTLSDYPTESGGIDWESADYDTRLEDLHGVHMSSLAQSLVSYLQEDYDSDDDQEERSQINDSSSDSESSEFQSVKINFNLGHPRLRCALYSWSEDSQSRP